MSVKIIKCVSKSHRGKQRNTGNPVCIWYDRVTTGEVLVFPLWSVFAWDFKQNIWWFGEIEIYKNWKEEHVFKKNTHYKATPVHHNLEYGDIKSGQLEDWLVKKIFFICMQSKKFKKELMLKFKMISRTCLNFMIVFMVYE